MLFRDRFDAGERLANQFEQQPDPNTVVLALPRGGIPLGISIAKILSAPLDVALAKKIGHPSHREFAIGAIAEGGEPILDDTIFVDKDWLQSEIKNVRAEIQRRREMYDEVLDKQSLENKVVILVDDGIATGMTMFAAIEAVTAENPRKIIVAVPIIPQSTYKHLQRMVDEIVYVDVPNHFLGAVGAYYRSFPQLQDLEVIKMLEEFNNPSEQ